jgi:tripartite-type tricarboxylate transporter receptor subunit TctC
MKLARRKAIQISSIALTSPLTTGLLFSPRVHGQNSPVTGDEYPNRPISLIVPFPPGGVADIVARPVAQSMAKFLKQSVVVENRAGAGGGVGMGAVAKAKPDGYTLLMALSSIAILPEADKVLQRTPLYQLNQLKAIARFTADPTVLVVRADSPWQTFNEFLSAIKRDPGKFNFGSSGNYGTMHVPMEMLKAKTSSFMVHVPYTGAGPEVLGLLSQQIDAVATGPASVLAQIKAGRLRALAHWGSGRLASLPAVPSFKELGIPIEFAQWAGLFVTAGTPESVVAKLREAASAAATDNMVIQTINTAGSPVQYLDQAAFETYVQSEVALMRDVVKRIGKVE